MSSYSTKYRKAHPEIYQKQQEQKKIKYENDPEYRERQIERTKNKYQNDPEFREKMIQKAKERYYRIKEMKLNNNILCN